MVPNNEKRISDIRRRVLQTERLAAMPQVVWRLMEALGNEKTTAKDLQNLIESDPALASRVLSLANSAFYSLREKVTTIQRAVVVIGFEELHVLIIGAGLAEVFDLKRIPQAIDGLGLWRHSLSTSWLASGLGRITGKAAPGELAIAGLLHDLGKLVLASRFSEEYLDMLQLVDQGVPYFEAEEQTGLDHAEIGFWLAKKWALPEVYLEVIRNHHCPNSDQPHFLETSLVLLADQIVKVLGVGSKHKARSVDHRMLLKQNGLSIDHLQEIARKASEHLAEVVNRWEQVLGAGGPLRENT